MKLKTEEEIKAVADKASEDWHPCLKGIDPDMYFTITEAFYEGAEWMQKDLISQASEGFDEYAELVRGKDAFNPCDNDWTIDEVEKVWQACSLHHAKKIQEKDAEIERLQKENEELRKQRDIALNDLSLEAKEFDRLQKENDELKKVIESVNMNLLLMLASYGDNTRTEKLIKDSLNLIKGEAK